MIEDPAGELLNLGRKAHNISPALRRALNARDRGCRCSGRQRSRLKYERPTSAARGRIFLGYLVVRRLDTPEEYETWMLSDGFDELYESLPLNQEDEDGTKGRI